MRKAENVGSNGLSCFRGNGGLTSSMNSGTCKVGFLVVITLGFDESLITKYVNTILSATIEPTSIPVIVNTVDTP